MGYPPNPLRNFALCKKKIEEYQIDDFSHRKYLNFIIKKRYTASNIRASFSFSDTEVF